MGGREQLPEALLGDILFQLQVHLVQLLDLVVLNLLLLLFKLYLLVGLEGRAAVVFDQVLKPLVPDLLFLAIVLEVAVAGLVVVLLDRDVLDLIIALLQDADVMLRLELLAVVEVLLRLVRVEVGGLLLLVVIHSRAADIEVQVSVLGLRLLEEDARLVVAVLNDAHRYFVALVIYFKELLDQLALRSQLVDLDLELALLFLQL